MFPYIILYTTQAFMACVGIIGILKYRHLINPLKVIVWYILFSLLVDSVKDVMFLYKIRTLWIDHWFSVGELLLYIKVFNYWRINRRYSIFLWFSFVVYLFVWIIGKFSFEQFEFEDVYSESISQIIQIAFGVPLLIAIIGDGDINWKNNLRFWIISGIVLYAAATFVLFALSNAMLTLSHQMMRMLYNINDLFIVIQYIFFLRAFLCKPIPISQDMILASKEDFQNQKSG